MNNIYLYLGKINNNFKYLIMTILFIYLLGSLLALVFHIINLFYTKPVWGGKQIWYFFIIFLSSWLGASITLGILVLTIQDNS